MKKSQIVEALHQGICTVTFTKVNGDERVMQCTLSSEMIPPSEAIRLANLMPEPKVKEVVVNNTMTNQSLLSQLAQLPPGRKVNENLVNVYVPDVGNWRSFRVDSVKSFVNAIGEELV
jgi:hypothetical protein